MLLLSVWLIVSMETISKNTFYSIPLPNHDMVSFSIILQTFQFPLKMTAFTKLFSSSFDSFTDQRQVL